MAEVVHTLSISGAGSPEYTSLATLESDMVANAGTWAAAWADNHVIAVMHAGSSDEINGRLAPAGTAMNGFRLIIRPQAGDGYRDHASAATNAQDYDNTKGACWKNTSGDYVIFGVSASVPCRVTIQDMQIDTTGSTVAAIRFTSEFRGLELYRNIIRCDGTDVVSIAPWYTDTCTIEGNLILAKGSGTHGLTFDYGGSGLTMNIRDNCFGMLGTAGSSVGINYVSGTIGGDLSNNTVFGFATDCDWTPTTGSHNATDKAAGGLPSSNRVNSIVPSSIFVSATVDFRLKASTAPTPLDAANNAVGPTTDRIGQAISNTTKDIGGWEYQAAVTAKKQRSNLSGGVNILSGGLNS